MSNQGRMTLHMKNKESAHSNSGMIGGSERWGYSAEWPDDGGFSHALALLDRERLWSQLLDRVAQRRALIGDDSVWGWIEWRRDGEARERTDDPYRFDGITYWAR